MNNRKKEIKESQSKKGNSISINGVSFFCEKWDDKHAKIYFGEDAERLAFDEEKERKEEEWKEKYGGYDPYRA